MYIHSVPQRIVSILLKSAACTLKLSSIFVLLLSVSVRAEWSDPLDSPALLTDRAHQALLLDITKAGSRLISVGGHGHVVYSDDNGISWKQASTPSSVTLTAVYFAGTTHGWAVGHDGIILHSSDAGETWVKQFDGYQANKAIVKAARANKEAALIELDKAKNEGNAALIESAEIRMESATYALEDAQYDAESGSTKPFLDVWFYDAKRGFAVGAYGMTFATKDGGKSWIDWSNRVDNPDRLHINGITMVGPRSLMMAGEQGMILRSDDMGDSWRSLPSPYEGSFFGIMSKSESVLVFGLRGNLFHSVDGGIRWEKVETGDQQTLLAAVTKADRSAVLVGNGGSVIFLNRRFENPQAITLSDRTAAAAVVQAADGSLVLVGEAGVNRIDDKGAVLADAIVMAEGDL